VEAFTQAVLHATHGQDSAQSASEAILSLAPAASAEDDVTGVVVRRLLEGAVA
jgi:sigma-B regulation protein RsbU (phosphoserine phosphatase)